MTRVQLMIGTGATAASSANRWSQPVKLRAIGFDPLWSACQCLRPPVNCMSKPSSSTRAAPNSIARLTAWKPEFAPCRIVFGRREIPPPASEPIRFRPNSAAARALIVHGSPSKTLRTCPAHSSHQRWSHA